MNTDDKKKFIIEKLIGELDLPQGAYEKAIKRYEDLGDWLSRDDSSLKDYEPHIFAQGSFLACSSQDQKLSSSLR